MNVPVVTFVSKCIDAVICMVATLLDSVATCFSWMFNPAQVSLCSAPLHRLGASSALLVAADMCTQTE